MASIAPSEAVLLRVLRPMRALGRYAGGDGRVQAGFLQGFAGARRAAMSVEFALIAPLPLTVCFALIG